MILMLMIVLEQRMLWVSWVRENVYMHVLGSNGHGSSHVIMLILDGISLVVLHHTRKTLLVRVHYNIMLLHPQLICTLLYTYIVHMHTTCNRRVHNSPTIIVCT